MSGWELSPPECQLGYTRTQLEAILGDRLDVFGDWMRGQTAATCDGRLYDHDKREYVPTDCGPHGMVVYGHDLRQFLAGGGPLD